MSDVVVPLISALLPLVVGGLATFLSRHKDRSTALYDLEILEKLNPDSRQARHIRDLVGRRVEGWWRRETSAASKHFNVMVGCLAALYVAAIGLWLLRYYTKAVALQVGEAVSHGDTSAAERGRLVVTELEGMTDVLAIVVRIVLALGALHSVLWFIRMFKNRKQESRNLYEVPSKMLLATRTTPDPTIEADTIQVHTNAIAHHPQVVR